jgi:hypothetical protein
MGKNVSITLDLNKVNFNTKANIERGEGEWVEKLNKNQLKPFG